MKFNINNCSSPEYTPKTVSADTVTLYKGDVVYHKGTMYEVVSHGTKNVRVTLSHHTNYSKVSMVVPRSELQYPVL